ncbi:hypothetical protein TRIP_B330138 [uncultured Desulfatiglans sp.]|uniref:Uncharacterized protein n=1 Tax=Uncultured Desulfatiglans sp. TaxID=1748965 RepID=A0A653A7J6_UNCDX|nr:hypothetical protein TRIP_B330138 [uncultured Desulfatiglans sp.]
MMVQVRFHPEMVFLANLGVNLPVCLCGDLQVASAQTLDFLDIGQKFPFPDWKRNSTGKSFPDGYKFNSFSHTGRSLSAPPAGLGSGVAPFPVFFPQDPVQDLTRRGSRHLVIGDEIDALRPLETCKSTFAEVHDLLGQIRGRLVSRV